MPVRSLNSSVLRWPDRDTVVSALHAWLAERRRAGDAPARVGYFGSYARGDWGPGSDLDVVLIAERESASGGARASRWDLSSLPVPVDVLLYSPQEWSRLPSGRFRDTMHSEIRWLPE